MDRRDISRVLLGSVAGAALLSERAAAQTCVAPCYPLTAAEIAAGVTPTNLSFHPGDVRRYGAVGDGSTNCSPAIQAACNQCAFGGFDVFVPGAASFYRCNSPITLSIFGVRIRGAGTQSILKFFNCDGFILQATEAFLTICGLELFSADASGVSDPRTHTGVKCTGTSGNTCNYVVLKDLYMRGWSRGIDFQWTWNSTIDNVTVTNSDICVRLFGQSCNNSICNSRLIADTASVLLQADTGSRGEGLTIGNTLLATGDYGIQTDASGFLALEVSNCVIDQITNTGIEATNSQAMQLTGNWILAANKGVNFNPLGSPALQNASLTGNYIRTTAVGSHCVHIGTNNQAISIVGGSLILDSNSGDVRCLFVSEPVADISMTGTHLITPSSVYSILDARGFLQLSNCTGYVSREITIPQYQTIASAASISIPLGEVFKVTGTTNIYGITTVDIFVPFRRVTLIFTGALTVVDGANWRLAGNFVTSADDTLTLVCDHAGIWFETSRSQN